MLKYILLDQVRFANDTVTGRVDAERRCLWLVDQLALLDAAYLRHYPNTPRLRESGVRLEDPPQSTEALCNVGKILAVGWADIESWAAWRLAELRMQGKKAEPYLIKKEGRYSLAIQLRSEYDEPAGFEVFFGDGRIEYRETI